MHSVALKPVFQCSVTASCGEDYRIGIQTDILRVNDFVGAHILQDTVLVDAG